MSDKTTKHYIINYNDITNIPFIDIDNEKLLVINNKLTTIYADTNLRQGKNINISLDGFINVTNTFINDSDINKIYYNGNVGIGTTNPSSLLNIYDSINSSNLLNISENGLILDTNINVVKNTIEIGSSTSKINKINCNFLNNIDTSFLTEDNLKNNIFYTRTDINGITSEITTTIITKSTDDRAYTTEIFTNSSNYTNDEILQVTSELKKYSDTQISTTLNNSSNYSDELFTNSSNYGEELFTNSSNYIDKEIIRVSGNVISNTFTTNIISELPSLKITRTYSDTQLLEQLAEETTGFDGWKLVRFLPDGFVSAFSSTDNLAGTDIYGNSTDFTTEWSIDFQSGGYDEYLFVGGNFVDWLILNKTQFIPLDGTNNEVIDAIKSSVNPNPHTVKVGTGDRPLIALTEWGYGKHLYQEKSGGTLQYGDGTYAQRPYYIFVRNSADKYSSVNIIGNIANASGIILKSDVNSTIDSKSFIILKSANGNVNDGIKIYSYKDDNLLISTNNNDIYSPTVILNNRRMILGYDTSEYFATPNTEIYNRTNTLEIKGDINVNGNLKKNNETINLNIWSTQTDNVNYIGDIIFKDSNTLTNTSYANGSLVTIAGDLSSNKQGLIIEKYDRTQRIGITDCSIKQLGSSVHAKLSITSKGNLPVSIGNETNNSLQIYENRALVNNKLGVNTGVSTLIVPLQVGLGTNTSGATSRSSVAILSGDSGGATELCALSLINSRQGAVGTACSLGFNLSNDWGPSVKINAICKNATTQESDLIFSTHNGTSLTEKTRILANGDIKFTGDLYYNDSLFKTTHLTEGTNLYYTDARVDTNIASKTTDDLTEGETNKYYTDTRVGSYLSTNQYAKITDIPTQPDLSPYQLKTDAYDNNDTETFLTDNGYAKINDIQDGLTEQEVKAIINNDLNQNIRDFLATDDINFETINMPRVKINSIRKPSLEIGRLDEITGEIITQGAIYISLSAGNPFVVDSSYPNTNLHLRCQLEDKITISPTETTSYNDIFFVNNTGITFSDLTTLNSATELITANKLDANTLLINPSGFLTISPEVLFWSLNQNNSIYYNVNSVIIGADNYTGSFKLYVEGPVGVKSLTIKADLINDNYTWNYFNINDNQTIYNNYYQTYLGNNAYNLPENVIHFRCNEVNTGFWFGSGLNGFWQQWLHINDYQLSTDRNFTFYKRSNAAADDVGIIFNDGTTLKTTDNLLTTTKINTNTLEIDVNGNLNVISGGGGGNPDLSDYALLSELNTTNTNVATNATNISANSTAITTLETNSVQKIHEKITLGNYTDSFLPELILSGPNQNTVSSRIGFLDGAWAGTNLYAMGIVYDSYNNILNITGDNDGNDIADTPNKLSVMRDGNVGIGKNIPVYKLDVNGDINCAGNLKMNGTNFDAEYIKGLLETAGYRVLKNVMFNMTFTYQYVTNTLINTWFKLNPMGDADIIRINNGNFTLDYTNYRINIPQTGTYRINYNMNFTDVSSDRINMTVSLYVNGEQLPASESRGSYGRFNGYQFGNTGGFIANLTSGDYLEFYGYMNIYENSYYFQINGGSSQLSIELIS